MVTKKKANCKKKKYLSYEKYKKTESPKIDSIYFYLQQMLTYSFKLISGVIKNILLFFGFTVIAFHDFIKRAFFFFKEEVILADDSPLGSSFSSLFC